MQKTPQAWKYEKKPKNTKENKIPHFPNWPQKQEKYRKITKTWPEMTIFVIFLYSLFFGAKPGMRDFVFLGFLFFVFPGLRGFCILYHPRGDRNSWLFHGPRFGQILRVLALEKSSESRERKHLNKIFTGLSRDFWGNFVYVFFLPHKE